MSKKEIGNGEGKEIGGDIFLTKWANSMRAFYGHPIYIVGSSLTKKEKPHDLDIVCIIPDEEFELRFCPIGKWSEEGGTGKYTEDGRWIWSDECIKMSLLGAKETKRKIDFKVYPKSFDLAYNGEPKQKIDTR